MKLEREGLRTHFMLLAGVIWPNKVLSSKIATYAVSVSSGLSVAVPKYSFPSDCASWFSFAVEVEAGALAELVGEELEEAEAEDTDVAWLLADVKSYPFTLGLRAKARLT